MGRETFEHEKNRMEQLDKYEKLLDQAIDKINRLSEQASINTKKLPLS